MGRAEGDDPSTPAPAGAGFEVKFVRGEDLHWIRVSVAGEIDLFTAPTVVEMILPAIRLHGTTVLDLAGVTYFGAAGIAALLRLHACTQALQGRLLLVGATHRTVRRPLAACHLDHFFDWHDP